MTAARAPGVRTAEAPKVAQAVPAHTLSASRAADASRARAPFAAPFEDPRVSTLLPSRVQMQTRVSSPGDPAEREAVATARKVMRMPAPPPSVSARGGTAAARATLNASTLLRAPTVHRSAAPPSTTIHRAPIPAPRPRAAAGPPRADDVMPEIRGEMTGGAPLPVSVRGYLEPRFRAEFGVVRVHTNEKAASLAARLSARAFTFGKHIFFGRGEYRPTEQEGMELIAHELTHTIQQKEVVQRQEAVTVSERSQPQVQRLGFDDILDWLADKANAIPGFRMFTIVLGVNPVNMSRVDRSAANVLRAVVEFIPGGNLITRALDTYGIFDKVGNWITGQIETLGMVGSAFKDAISDFIDSLGWRDLFRPGSVWRRAKRIFTDPIDKLIDFAKGFIGGILDFLREAVLRPLAKLAEGTRAYDLLKAVLGKDPITGDPVEQSADVLIGGFMKLIGQEEVWENIKKGNAVAKAFAWFKGVLSGVLAFVSAVPGMIISTIKSITLMDFLPITNLFAKVGRAFAGFVGSFLSWGLDQVLGLLQIIFEVVIPRAVPYIKKAAGAFKTIIRDPIRFIGNLVRAGVLGFRQFSGRFLSHLGKSLVEWLTGSMRGANIYVPQALSLPEIVKFALSVLGLTWANIRQKLVTAVGETAVSAMEAGFAVVKTLVTQGPAAAWEQIKEGIGNLQQMVMGQIMTYVRNQIVVQTIQKLVTSLNPAGAFIQAVIAIYNTVMFFIERLRQIGQVVASFIDSIAAIASGAVGAAANRVETTMAGLLTLVISFLARLAGLGKVSDEVVKVVNRIREPIDKGLDRVVAWIVAQARRLGRFVAQAGVPQDPATRLRLGTQAATAVLNRFRGRPVGAAVLRPLLPAIIVRYGLTALVPFERGGRWWVRASINPQQEAPSEAQPEGAAGAAAGATGPLRSLTGQPVTLPRVTPGVLAEVQQTAAGATLYENRRGSGPQLVPSILRAQPAARFDNASGVLALPPVSAATLAGATSLRGMAQLLGQATGVTRITLSKSATGWALDAHVNPTLAGLASHAAPAGLAPLIAEIGREENRVSPQQEALMAICREAAGRHGAAVQFTWDGRNQRYNALFSIPGAAPAVQFQTHIVTTSDNLCPACQANVGVTAPHNIIPASMWRAAIETTLGSFGVTVLDAWALEIVAAGRSTGGPAVTEDRQCRACETNQDRGHAPHSAIQRRRGAAAGFVLTTRPGTPAGTTGEMFVGRQLGEAGGAAALTDAQLLELTRLKIDQVLDEITTRIGRATTGAGGARPVTSQVNTNIVVPGQVAAFLARLRRSIMARATANRSAASFR